jgi:inorganic phosphate transporter, PiT family
MLETYAVRFWVIIACHLAMGGGTLAGRWRMVKTMGQRITKLNPSSVFAAKAAGALTLMGTAHFGIPVSTRHTIAGAIVGAGELPRLTRVRSDITPRIVWAWVLTILGAASPGAILDHLLRRWGS